MIDEILKEIASRMNSLEGFMSIKNSEPQRYAELKAFRLAIEHIDYLQNLYDYVGPNHKVREIAEILGVKEGEK